MQVSPSIEERLATLERAINDVDRYIKNDTKSDIAKLEQYLREYEDDHKEDIEKIMAHIEKSNSRCDKTFRWMIGIFTTAFVSLVLFVVTLYNF